MKQNKTILIAFIFLVVAGALYRLIPGRMPGFFPQLAMAIFGGAVIKDKKWAFAVPLFSMVLSDLLFEVLNRTGIVHNMPGFYPGQWINYILLSSAVFLGMMMKRISVMNVAASAVAAPVLYFLLSNFATWAGSGGYARPLTGAGLFQCYVDGLPFFPGTLLGTVTFSALFFGGYYFFQRSTAAKMQKALA